MPAGLGFGFVVAVDERALGDQDLGVHHVGVLEDGADGGVAEERDERNFKPVLDFHALLAHRGELRTGAAEEVGRRKAQSGKDMIVWGSLSLARSLMKAKLIDQYQLVICPVVMGRGTPLFREDGPALDLKLQEATRFDRGAVLLRYSS